MHRSSSTLAIVLRKTRVGEIHKSLTLLTPTIGLVNAMAHGALKIKSRLRTASEPFHLLKVYLYHEPVKNQYKITDMESIYSCEGIRRSVAKYYTASLWAEAALKSYGGGESYAGLFRLLTDGLKLLDLAPAGRELLISIQVLARFLALSGHSVELDACARCQLPFESQGPVFLSQEDGAFVCAACACAGNLSLPAGARYYLEKTINLPLAQAAVVGLEQASLRALRDAAYFLVQNSLESSLNSLHCGAGIL